MSGTIYWPEICGKQTEYDAFWSDEITVNTDNPDFTDCFQETVLSWIPCVVLLLCVPFYLYFLCRRPTMHHCMDVSSFNFIKTLLTCCVLMVVALDLFKALSEYDIGEDVPRVKFITPAVKIVTMFFAVWITQYEYWKGIHSNGVLFIFWLVSFICGIVTVRSKILRVYATANPKIEDLFRFVTFFSYFGLATILFICNFFADLKALEKPASSSRRSEKRPLLEKEDGKEEEETCEVDCPEKKATFLSRITFWWITGLIYRGYKKTLTFTDVWPLTLENSSKKIVKTFEREWNEELKKIPNLTKRQMEEQTKYQEVAYRGGKADESEASRGPSFFRASCRAIGGFFALSGLYKLLYDIVSFINPQILNALISWISSVDREQYVWRGFVYSLSMFAVCIIRTILFQLYNDGTYVTGMRLRTAVTGVIYRKALRLSSAAKRTSTVGEIVNLMSVDAQKLQDCPVFLHMLWSAPLTIALALYFLYQQLGPAVFAGLGIMILFVPINAYVAGRIRKLQITQMRKKDGRIKLMNEVLNGIKVLKLYAWEGSFQTNLLDIREEELQNLKTASYLNAISAISWFCAPFLVALTTFAVYVLSSPSNILDPNKAFVSLSLFNMMNYPLSILPTTITFSVQASVSLNRISNFLKNEELDPDTVSHQVASEPIIVENGAFSWGSGDEPVLKNINLKVKTGSLVAVVGSVGSGKSSLIQAMLGEMERLRGFINVHGSTAYVPQQAWVQNATLRDNILFSRRYNRSKYEKVIEACALGPDLKILPGGDMTEIGEKGINVSGGQKQRISLARAVYQDNDIFLMDDPLSAVDSHVGKHIFDQVIGPNGLLRNKTRILVTNGIAYLPQVDYIVVLKNGLVSEMGGYQELLSHNGAFSDFIQTYLNEDVDEDEEEDVQDMKRQLRRQITLLSGTDSGSETEKTPETVRHRKRSLSRSKSFGKTHAPNIKEIEKQRKEKLIEKESEGTGAVKLSVYKSYLQACGLGYVLMTILSYMCYLAAQVGTNIWLSVWSNDGAVNGTQDPALTDLRLGVYGGLGASQTICVLFQSLGIAIGCVNASRSTHNQLLFHIMRAPMSFFDTTPLGRIINRFSKDVDTVDVNIPQTLRILLGTLSGVLTTLIVITYTTPVFLAVIVPLFIVFYFIQRFYISTSRQLKRIDSVKRSPIYSHFGESIVGASSIRAYQQMDRFILKSDRCTDENQMAYYANIVSARWLGIWLEMLGNCIVLFAALFAVLGRNLLNAGTVGLSVSYALQVTSVLNMVVRMSCDLENYIVAVERKKKKVPTATLR